MTNDQLEKIAELTKAIKAQEDQLESTKQKYIDLTTSRKQRTCQVIIGSVSLDVTAIDRYGDAKIIRGREMIYLGVQKVLNSIIEGHQARIKELRQQCIDVARGSET